MESIIGNPICLQQIVATAAWKSAAAAIVKVEYSKKKWEMRFSLCRMHVACGMVRLQHAAYESVCINKQKRHATADS